jgi:hypothetical protein
LRDQRGKFTKGHSGNPKGRAPGTRNKATQAALALLDGETEALTRKVIELALDGDTTALRLCLERITPPVKEQRLDGLELPEINCPQDVLKAVSEVSQRLAEGSILPSQAAALCQVFEHYRRHFETSELEERISRLEELK